MNLGRLFLLCLVLCLPGRASAFAAGAAGLVEQGNAAFAAGDYAGALEFYERAAAKGPRPEIAFNRAAALYRLGKTGEAAGLWQEATAAAGAPALAYAARYNAGNAFYRQGEEAMAAEPEAAIDLFGKSADSFRAALAADPGGRDAGRNLELANRRIAQLRQRLQQEKQQRGQPGENGQQEKGEPETGQEDEGRPGETGDPLQDLHDRQEQLRGQSQSLADRQQAGQDIAEQAGEEAGRQEDLRRQTEEAAQQAGPRNEDLREAADQQKKAEEALKNGQPREAAEHQQQAADRLARAMADGREEEAQPPQEDTAAGQPQQDGDGDPRQTAAPAADSAQDILNAERTRQLQLQRMLRQGGRRVDKDW